MPPAPQPLPPPELPPLWSQMELMAQANRQEELARLLIEIDQVPDPDGVGGTQTARYLEEMGDLKSRLEEFDRAQWLYGRALDRFQWYVSRPSLRGCQTALPQDVQRVEAKLAAVHQRLQLQAQLQQSGLTALASTPASPGVPLTLWERLAAHPKLPVPVAQCMQSMIGQSWFAQARLLDHALQSGQWNVDMLEALVLALVAEHKGSPEDRVHLEPMLQQLLEHMIDPPLTSTSLVKTIAELLGPEPSGTLAHLLSRYLTKAGLQNEFCRMWILRQFTPEVYSQFLVRSTATPPPVGNARTWNDWEYQGWAGPVETWPLGDLVFTISADDKINHVLRRAVWGSGPVTTSLVYYLLRQLWRDRPGPSVDRIQALGSLMRRAAEQGQDELRDRAALVLQGYWHDLFSNEVASMAAEAYVHLTARQWSTEPALRGQLPNRLSGMDAVHLQQIWPFGPEAMRQLMERWRR